MDWRTARRVLGTGPTATYTQIRKAFREQVKRVHPDLNRGMERRDALAKVSTLTKAYKFLMEFRSPFQRERYRSAKRGGGRFALVKKGEAIQ